MSDSALTDVQAAAWANYQRMRVRLAGRLNRELSRQTGLSEADAEILFALSESADDSVRALALRCGLEWEKSRLSHQLRRMEQRGLLIRRGCFEDNRGSVISLTDAGRRLARDARRAHESAVRTYLIDALTERQLEELGAVAEAVLAGLEGPGLA